MSDGACCTHSRVVRLQLTDETTGWSFDEWRCQDCRSAFCHVSEVEQLRAERDAAVAKADQYDAAWRAAELAHQVTAMRLEAAQRHAARWKKAAREFRCEAEEWKSQADSADAAVFNHSCLRVALFDAAARLDHAADMVGSDGQHSMLRRWAKDARDAAKGEP